MKKTQMIHSPRIFNFGLGLMLAASLASMPVLTGASERQDAKAAAASKKRSTVESEAEPKTRSKGKRTKTKPQADSVTEKSAAKADGGTRKAKSAAAAAEDRARDRIGKLEQEAKKIAAQLSSSERKKLLALINDSKTGELATIRGIGKSRSTAIEKARPIESIEDLPKVKGIGLKTLADVVDHGRGVAPGNTSAPKPSPSDSKAGRSEDDRKGTAASKEKGTKKA